MPTQSELRRAWAPSCVRKHRPFLMEGWLTVDQIMEAWRYAPRNGETWGANCRPVTGGDAPSFHAYRDDTAWSTWTGVIVQTAIATDFNSLTNPYGPKLVTDMPRGMVDAILGIRTKNGKPVFDWGGYFKKNKDGMHYEVACFPADLATGIDPASVHLPGPAPDPTPSPIIREDVLSMLPRCVQFKGAVFLVGYSADEFERFDAHDQPTGEMVTGPWRKTFPNPSRLAQIVECGGCVVDPQGNAFPATNPQFEVVYLNRGVA